MKIDYYYSDTCKCCRDFKPVIEKYATAYDIPINYIDISIDKTDVSGIPYTEFIDDEGNKIFDILGNMNEKILKYQIDKYLFNKNN